jgi:hypothetical protein
MKKIIFIISFFAIYIGCNKKEIKIQNQGQEFLKEENINLKKKINLLTSELALHQKFERNVENEYKVSLDSTVLVYNLILKEKLNDNFKELVQTRIKNILKNKSFYSKTEGWKISPDGIPLKPKVGTVNEKCR